MFFMANPHPAQRPWEAGIPKFVTDRNGVTKKVYTNPYKKQEAALRQQAYSQHPGGDQFGEKRTTLDNPDAMPVQAPPVQQAPLDAQWMVTLQQRYAQDIPMRLSLKPGAPEVTPEMLNPTDEQLAQMTEDEREGIARVFLSLVAKYFADNSLQRATYIGQGIQGYIPAMMISHFNRLKGGY